MSGVPMEQRPFGYLFVESQYKQFNETHKCEICFSDSIDSITITCLVNDIDRHSHRYSLLIFRDDGMTRPLLFTDVYYSDLAGKFIQLGEELEAIDPKWIRAGRECLATLVGSIHTVIYNHAGLESDSVPSNNPDRWVGFDRETCEMMRSQAAATISVMVLALRALLT